MMRRALYIGIDGYRRSPLHRCVSDAHRLGRLLARHDDGAPNFFPSYLESPVDGPDRLVDRDSFMKNLDVVLGGRAEVVLLYFAGHGIVHNGHGHLLMTDGNHGNPNNGIAMSELVYRVNQVGSEIGEIVILLDCCASGAFGQALMTPSNTATLREGVSVLTATAATGVALEGSLGGVFTDLVCQALDGGAADVLGRVTVASVYSHLDQSLEAWGQRPMLKAHVWRLVELRRCWPAVPCSILRKFPEWFEHEDSELPLDESYEPTEKPHHPEHEALFAELQKCRDAQLIEPVGVDHLYYAAMERKSCRLTSLGRNLWLMASKGRL